MTWKEKRIITALCTVLAVLFAVLLIVLSIRYRQNRQQETVEEDLNIPVVGEAVEEGAFVKLRFCTDTTTLTFAMNKEGHWTWADDPKFPLNDETLLTVLNLMENLKPQQTLPAQGGPEAYDLASPAASVTATRTDGSELSIIMGKATTDGASRYAMMNGDEATVYILAGDLFKLVQTPIYQMMRLPELPQPTEEQLVSLTIQGPKKAGGAARTVTLTATQEEDRTLWSDGAKDVTDSKLVAALVEDMAHLAITRCIDYAPSDRAADICELTNPAAVLTVHYNTGKQEQEVQLTVGGRLTDGSGRYLRLDGEKPIYFLSTELLDPLMHIAALGLDG